MDDAAPGSKVWPSGDRTVSALHATLVETAAERLGADCCEFLVEGDDQLMVRSSSGPGTSEGSQSYPLGLGIPGRAYETGTACVIDDLADTRSTAPAGAGSSPPAMEFRSLCCVPVGSWGLLLAKSYRPGAFSDRDVGSIEPLVEFVRGALERASASRAAVSDGGRRDARDPTTDLEEIADILSHDLSNPLNVAQGNLELARESGGDQYVERAAAAINRVEELVAEVVILARTGTLVQHMEPVELRERSDVAWQNVQTEDATLCVLDSVTFRASKRGVCHLLENLIENAIFHAGADVTIRIGVLEDGFFVEDDGPGIPESHRDRLFDRGYAIESGRSGLGLHIVNRIVEAHDWAISVGTASAGGARFEITGVDREST